MKPEIAPQQKDQNEQAQLPNEGDLFRHFKTGQLYFVLSIDIDCDVNEESKRIRYARALIQEGYKEPRVVLDATSPSFSRSAALFMGDVFDPRTSVRKRRFEPVSKDDAIKQATDSFAADIAKFCASIQEQIELLGPAEDPRRVCFAGLMTAAPPPLSFRAVFGGLGSGRLAVVSLHLCALIAECYQKSGGDSVGRGARISVVGGSLADCREFLATTKSLFVGHGCCRIANDKEEAFTVEIGNRFFDFDCGLKIPESCLFALILLGKGGLPKGNREYVCTKIKDAARSTVKSVVYIGPHDPDIEHYLSNIANAKSWALHGLGDNRPGCNGLYLYYSPVTKHFAFHKRTNQTAQSPELVGVACAYLPTDMSCSVEALLAKNEQETAVNLMLDLCGISRAYFQ